MSEPLTIDTMSPKLAGSLYKLLCLREDHTSGVCWAWMDSAERVCLRPDDQRSPHLCTRHAKVALARALREASRDARVTMSPERRAMIEARMARNSAALSDVDRSLDRLTGGTLGPLDHGVLNTPICGRGITDSQLARFRELSSRQDSLKARVALDTARLRTGRG